MKLRLLLEVLSVRLRLLLECSCWLGRFWGPCCYIRLGLLFGRNLCFVRLELLSRSTFCYVRLGLSLGSIFCWVRLELLLESFSDMLSKGYFMSVSLRSAAFVALAII